MSLCVDIPCDPRAPARARQAIRSLADRGLEPGVAHDVTLLVSELVSNSVKYGGDGRVRLQATSQHPRHAHVEVVDDGSGFVPMARDRPATEAGGWGLHLVEELSDRWGVRTGSTHVWFEIDRAG